MPEPIFMKLGICIMATELVSTAYFINSSTSVCVSLGVSLISLQGNGSAESLTWPRTHATIEELLKASFSLRSMSYQKEESVGLSVYPPIVARQRLEKHVPVATKNRRRHFPCAPCYIKGKWAISSYQKFFFNVDIRLRYCYIILSTHKKLTLDLYGILGFHCSEDSYCRTQWPRGLRHELSSLARTLGS
jgi:hypothetical protein